MSDDEEILELEADKSSSVDYSRRASVPAGGKALVAINPVDANRFALTRVSFDPWGPPGGMDGDTISWAETLRFIGSRQQWFRVIEVSNSSQYAVSVMVNIRVL